MSKPAPPVPMRGWAEVISEEERETLGRLASSGSPPEWGDAGRAADILRCVNVGVMPPQESVDWFVRRFRSGR